MNCAIRRHGHWQVPLPTIVYNFLSHQRDDGDANADGQQDESARQVDQFQRYISCGSRVTLQTFVHVRSVLPQPVVQ